MASPRNVALQAMRTLWQKRRNRKYFVKRGAVNWAVFPFAKYPFAVAILLDQCSLLKEEGRSEATVTFEIFCKMPEQKVAEAMPEIDDELLDQIVDDVEDVLKELKRMRDPANPKYPVCLKVNTEQATCIETNDVELAVQGVICQFEIGY